MVDGRPDEEDMGILVLLERAIDLVVWLVVGEWLQRRLLNASGDGQDGPARR